MPVWFIGHFSIAYFISKSLDRKTFLDPWMFPLVVLFSNLPDTFHIVGLRTLAHNLFGNLFIAFFGVLLLALFVKLSLKGYLILFMASFSHFIGDLLFGSYYPFLPLSFRKVYVFDFNSWEHLTFEVLVSTLFIILFWTTGEQKRFGSWIRTLFSKRTWNAKGPFSIPITAQLLVIGILTMSFIQLMLFIRMNIGLIDRWYFWADIAVIGYFLILPIIAFIPLERNKKGSSDGS